MSKSETTEDPDRWWNAFLLAAIFICTLPAWAIAVVGWTLIIQEAIR